MRAALERQDVVVTNNAWDYRRLYARLRTHPGLVILRPSASLSEQRELFRRVMTFVGTRPDVTDQMVTVRRDGSVTIEPWPRRP